MIRTVVLILVILAGFSVAVGLISRRTDAYILAATLAAIAAILYVVKVQ